MTMNVTMMSVTDCVYGGDNNDNDNGDVLSVCGSVHAVWRDSISFPLRFSFICCPITTKLGMIVI